VVTESEFKDLTGGEPAPAAAPVVMPPTIISAPALPAQPRIVYTDKPRVVAREGWVRLAGSVQAPADYELRSFRFGEGLMNYLVADDTGIVLRKFRGKLVTVVGEEWIDPAWPRYPVIRVTQIREAY
jgi:hypothetical protein